MTKNYLGVCVFATLVLFGCKQKETGIGDYLKPDFKQKHLNSASLLFADTIKVAVPDESFNFFSKTDLLDDRFFYGFSSLEPLDMSVFDLQERTFVRFVRFDMRLMGGRSFPNFKVLSPDSLLFAVGPSKRLVLTDGRGKRLSMLDEDNIKITADDDAYLVRTGYEWATNSNLENMSYDSATNLLYIPLAPRYSSTPDTEAYLGAARHGIYDLSNKSWKALYGTYEGTLKYLGDSHYYQDMEDSYQLVTSDNIYITYPVDHSVYIYDKNSLKLKKSVDISPSMAVDTPEPLQVADVYDRKVNELRRSSPFYGPLYYHEGVNKFSRFYNLKPVQNEASRRAIVVYDDKFNIVAEKVFPMQEISRIQPTPTGFIIQPNDPMVADVATFFRVYITDNE